MKRDTKQWLAVAILGAFYLGQLVWLFWRNT